MLPHREPLRSIIRDQIYFSLSLFPSLSLSLCAESVVFQLSEREAQADAGGDVGSILADWGLVLFWEQQHWLQVQLKVTVTESQLDSSRDSGICPAPTSVHCLRERKITIRDLLERWLEMTCVQWCGRKKHSMLPKTPENCALCL